MVDIVDNELKILNIIDTDIITENNQRPHYPWLIVGDTWTDVMPVDYAKTEKRKELKTARDNNDYLAVTTAIGSFDFGAMSQGRINNAIQITTGTRNWTLADGTIVEVTKDDLVNVIRAGAERSDRIHNKWLELEAQVEAATTTEEVNAIVWEVVNNG